MEQVAFSVARKTIIDYMLPDGISMFSRRTIDELRDEYPDAQVASVDEARQTVEACFITEVTETMRAQFIDALEMLPPMNWRRTEGSESFMMSERIYGSVTRIWVRIEDVFFTFADTCNRTHAEVLGKVAAYRQGKACEEGTS